jgi:multiple sugar transport system substrate-binding protein
VREEIADMRSSTWLRTAAGAAVLGLVLGACGPRGGTASEGPAATAPPPPTPAASAEAGASVEPTPPPDLKGDLTVWTYPQGDDETSLKAYKAAFEKLYPNVSVKISVIPEDTYATKVNTALQAHKPPDIAVIEDRGWMKAGRVLDLTPYYASWGVNVADFNPGGLARAAVEGDVNDGVYAVGDFLGGNIFVYNKAMFDAAGIPYPSADTSLTIQEYADICRKLAKPDPDPTKTVYGCSMPEWAPGIQSKDVFGPDGRKAEGNMNSPEMVDAFNIAGALVREKAAPGGTALTAIGESDLFAEGRLGITWTDFTETPKYEAANLEFGLAPFLVIKPGESFVDTWTAPWGTFTEATNQEAALEFLRWLATDGQTVRMETSADPSLSMPVAEAHNYGADDPVKEAYLKVLSAAARPQVFVPPGVEAWDPAEVLRQLTIGGQTDAKPILDKMAAATQTELDRVWAEWEKIGQ